LPATFGTEAMTRLSVKFCQDNDQAGFDTLKETQITLRGRDGSSAVDVSLELLTASQVVRTHLLCALKSRMAGRRLLDVNYGFSAVLSADEEKVDRMDSRYLGFLSLKYSPASCFKSTCPADQLQLLVQ
ncbi:hypothetical protein KCU69_g52, partial [Aureobasidium melanogenum]